MSNYTYFGFWRISLKFITKNHTGSCKQGSPHKLADRRIPASNPKPELGERYTLSIVHGYLFK